MQLLAIMMHKDSMSEIGQIDSGAWTLLYITVLLSPEAGFKTGSELHASKGHAGRLRKSFR